MKKIALLYLITVIGFASAEATNIKIPHKYYQNQPLQVGDTPAFWMPEASGFGTPLRGIQQIVIPNSGSAWATAYDGTGNILSVQDYTRSTDSGRTWTAGIVDSSAPNLAWSCLTAIGGDTAWGEFFDGVALGGGFVYKTVDGVHWTKQNVFSSSSFADVIHFWNANTGVAFGDPLNKYYEIYTTSDGGTTWTRVSSDSIPAPLAGEGGLTFSVAVRGNVIWCGTGLGRILKSTDFGHHWSVLTISGAAGKAIPHMTFIDEAHGYAEAQSASGAITWYQTADSGSTWSVLTPLSGTMFTDDIVYVPNTTETLVSTGVNFNLALGSSYSLDGGNTWNLIDTGVQYTTHEFFNESTGYAGGFNTDAVTGGIYKFAGSFTITGVPIVSTNNFNLNIYPNPAHGKIYVSFHANNSDPIYVHLYDVLGKEVLNASFKDQSQMWLRTLDVSSLSNGVYAIEVDNNGSKQVQKIVVKN